MTDHATGKGEWLKFYTHISATPQYFTSLPLFLFIFTTTNKFAFATWKTWMQLSRDNEALCSFVSAQAKSVSSHLNAAKCSVNQTAGRHVAFQVYPRHWVTDSTLKTPHKEVVRSKGSTITHGDITRAPLSPSLLPHPLSLSRRNSGLATSASSLKWKRFY